MATLLERKGVPCYPSTVAKIECGDRAVRAVELVFYAEVFATSIDALVGRNRGSDLVWAAGNLTSNAQKMAGEVEALHRRLVGEYDDVRAAVGRGGVVVDNLLEFASAAIGTLGAARDRLNALASQFPIPS